MQKHTAETAQRHRQHTSMGRSVRTSRSAARSSGEQSSAGLSTPSVTAAAQRGACLARWSAHIKAINGNSKISEIKKAGQPSRNCVGTAHLGASKHARMREFVQLLQAHTQPPNLCPLPQRSRTGAAARVAQLCEEMVQLVERQPALDFQLQRDHTARQLSGAFRAEQRCVR